MEDDEKIDVKECVNCDNVGVISLLPDELFFIDKIEVKEQLSKKQINALVINAIADNSPFQEEQLYWGFVKKDFQKKNSVILWYAGLRDRITSLVGQLSDTKHYMPHIALGLLFSNKNCQCVCCKNTCNIFVASQLVETCKTTDATFEYISNVLTKLNEAKDLPVSKIIVEDSKIGRMGDIKLCFVEETEKTNTKEDIHISSEIFWNADIREKSLIKNLKRQRKIDKIAKSGIVIAGYFIAVLCLLEFVLMGFQAVLFHKNKLANRLQPKAFAIENKDSLTQQIQSTVEQEIRPFELLGILNHFKPKSIYFSSAVIDNLHNVKIEAVANSAFDVDNYRGYLENSGFFEEVLVENITSTHQGTKFTIFCDFLESILKGNVQQ